MATLLPTVDLDGTYAGALRSEVDTMGTVASASVALRRHAANDSEADQLAQIIVESTQPLKDFLRETTNDDLVPCVGCPGWTALHIAAARGSTTCARVLLDAGADPDEASSAAFAARSTGTSRFNSFGIDRLLHSLSHYEKKEDWGGCRLSVLCSWVFAVMYATVLVALIVVGVMELQRCPSEVYNPFTTWWNGHSSLARVTLRACVAWKANATEYEGDGKTWGYWVKNCTTGALENSCHEGSMFQGNSASSSRCNYVTLVAAGTVALSIWKELVRLIDDPCGPGWAEESYCEEERSSEPDSCRIWRMYLMTHFIQDFALLTGLSWFLLVNERVAHILALKVVLPILFLQQLQLQKHTPLQIAIIAGHDTQCLDPPVAGNRSKSMLTLLQCHSRWSSEDVYYYPTSSDKRTVSYGHVVACSTQYNHLLRSLPTHIQQLICLCRCFFGTDLCSLSAIPFFGRMLANCNATRHSDEDLFYVECGDPQRVPDVYASAAELNQLQDPECFLEALEEMHAGMLGEGPSVLNYTLRSDPADPGEHSDVHRVRAGDIMGVRQFMASLEVGEPLQASVRLEVSGDLHLVKLSVWAGDPFHVVKQRLREHGPFREAVAHVSYKGSKVPLRCIHLTFAGREVPDFDTVRDAEIETGAQLTASITVEPQFD